MTKEELIKKYGRRESTPQESEAARALIFEDTDNFTALLLAMRSKAMEELNLDPKDDFLEDLLRERAPNAFSEYNVFANSLRDMDYLSALPAHGDRRADDIFSHLRSTLLDGDDEW